MNKRIMVTGALGFIGTNLVKKLEESFPQNELLLIDNKSNSVEISQSILKSTSHIIDICDFNELIKFEGKVDVIVHLAASGSVPKSIEFPHKTFLNNVLGTQNVAELARRSGSKLIFASSSSIFGANENKETRDELSERIPISPYGHSKFMGELILENYKNSFDLDSLSLRFFNVFGPYQTIRSRYSAVIPLILESLETNSGFNVYGDGDQSRDFTFVEDVVDVIISLINQNKFEHKCLNVAWGQEITINSIIEIVRKNLKPDFKVNYVSKRVGDIYYSRNKPTLLNKVSSIIPTKFEEAILSTYAWYQNNQ